MRLAILIFLFPFLLFSSPQTIYFAITPTTNAKLKSIVLKQLQSLRRFHRVILIPFSQAVKGNFDFLIIAGEEPNGVYTFNARKLILDFCNSCNHIPDKVFKRSTLLICSTSPLLWFGYGNLYNLKSFTIQSISQAIKSSYQPFGQQIAYYFGYIEIEIWFKSRLKQRLRIPYQKK